MTDKQIECFIAIAESLNFTQASEKLFMSQPTISRQINLLEEELGFELFYRNHKSVRLTSAGLVMLKAFREMEEIYETQKYKALQMNLGKTGSIKIGLVTNLDIDALWDTIIPKFQKQYPDISLQYECYPFHTIAEKLNQTDMDIIFTHATEQIKAMKFEYDIVFTTQMRLVCGKKHPIAQKGCFSSEDLKNETVWTIFPEENQRTLLKKLYHQYGVSHFPVKSVPNFSTVLVNVRMGNGILFIDPITRRLPEDSFYQLTLPEEVSEVSIAVMWNKNNLNPAIPLLLKFLGCETLPR